MSVHHLVILYQIFQDNNNFEMTALEILSIFVTIEVTGNRQQTSPVRSNQDERK